MGNVRVLAAALAALVLGSGTVAASTFHGDYEVMNFTGGQHGLWLDEFVVGQDDSYDKWGIDAGTFSYAGTTAMLNASLINAGDSNLTATISMEFEKRASAPPAPKCEYGACPAEVVDWEFFDIVTASFSGTGAIAGLELIFAEFPTNADFPPQLGIGANSKVIDELGFATWLSWDGVDGSTGSGYSFDPSSATEMPGQHGDVNIRLVPISAPPPPEVPLPAAGWLLLAGVSGLVALKRRQG